MLSFPPIMNNLVTAGLNFLLEMMSAIISSKTINDFLFFVRLKYSKFSETSSTDCK